MARVRGLPGGCCGRPLGTRWQGTAVLALAIAAVMLFVTLFPPASHLRPGGQVSDEEMFFALVNSKTFTKEGNFLKPVVGPSSPKGTHLLGGRLWIIVAQDTGLIEMNNVTEDETPFANPAPSVSIRIQDLALSTPLSDVLYLVPGMGVHCQPGPDDDLSRNGLLAFVANRQLILMDPFERRILHRQDIGFQPTWLVEDPLSAGEMYDAPCLVGGYPGGQHAYRFIAAANATHLSVLRVDYRSSKDSPQIPANGVVSLLSVDMSITGVPLPYYLQYQPAKSGIFVPTSGGRLRVFSIRDPIMTSDVVLSLYGESANVSAPIGFDRAPEISTLYVPLKSASRVGMAYVAPQNVSAGDVRAAHTLVINNTDAGIASQPDPANTGNPYFVLTHYEGSAAVRSDVLRTFPNGSLDPGFDMPFESPIKSFFYSPTSSHVLALDTAGTIWRKGTSQSSEPSARLVNMFGDSLPGREHLLYMGSPGGTKYSVLLYPAEILGFAFEPATGKGTVFEVMYEPESPTPTGESPQPDLTLLYVLAPVIAAVVATVVVVVVLLRGRPPATKS